MCPWHEATRFYYKRKKHMTGILTKIPSLYAFFVQPSPQHLVLLPNTHSGLLVCFLSHRQNRLWPGQMSNELIEDLWAL